MGAAIRERLRAMDPPQLVGLAVLAIVVVVGAGFWYVRSLPSPVRVEALSGSHAVLGGPSPPTAGPSVAPTATPDAPLVVYVSG